MAEKDINYNIFLIGFMGAGKSTIAKELQKRLGFGLVEMDARIVEEQGMSINDIFSQFGEERFRDIESQLILDLGHEEASIVSCGGGVVVRSRNTEFMKQSGKVVYLTASPETVFQRVRYSTDRPILNGNMNVEYIKGLMEKRQAFYEDAADLMVATDNRSQQDICDEIIRRLHELDT